MKNILNEANKTILNKMRDEIKKQKKDERTLFYLVFGITGFSILFNNIAPLITIFLIFYFEVHRDKIIKK